MKIKELKDKHPLIYKRALECQKEQGNEVDDELKLHYFKVDGSFDWDKTREGGIWNSVDDGNYQPFYDFHNLPNPEKEVTTDNKPKIIDLAKHDPDRIYLIGCALSGLCGDNGYAVGEVILAKKAIKQADEVLKQLRDE